MGSVSLNKKDKMESILEDEQIRLNVILVLMEIKPYRRSIITQIFNSRHELHKNWKDESFEFKTQWIKDNMFHKWTKEQFISHIMTSVKVLKFNQNLKFSLEMALGVDDL